MKPRHSSLSPRWGELSALSEHSVKGPEVRWVSALHLEFPVSGCTLSTLLPGILRQKLLATSQNFWDGHADRPPHPTSMPSSHTHMLISKKKLIVIWVSFYIYDTGLNEIMISYTVTPGQCVCMYVYIKEIHQKSHLPQKSYAGKLLSIYFHFRSIFTGLFILKHGGNS